MSYQQEAMPSRLRPLPALKADGPKSLTILFWSVFLPAYRLLIHDMTDIPAQLITVLETPDNPDAAMLLAIPLLVLPVPIMPVIGAGPHVAAVINQQAADMAVYTVQEKAYGKQAAIFRQAKQMILDAKIVDSRDGNSGIFENP